MLLRTVWSHAVDRTPHAVALVDGDRRYTYAELDERVRRVAAALTSLGVGPGDHVVTVLKNSDEQVTTYWACQAIGAVFTPLNFRGFASEIAYCIQDAQPKVVVFEPSTDGQVAAAAQEAGYQGALVGAAGAGRGWPQEVRDFDRLAEAAPIDRLPALAESAPAIMLYTSGTTGRPKGVPRSQKAEYASGVAQCIQHHWSFGESTLGTMPIYHTMGMRKLVSMPLVSGKLVVTRDFDPADALRLIEAERISCLYLVPTVFHMLLNDPNVDRFDLSSVRHISWAGAPMAESLVSTCFEKLAPETFINHYGSTEIYTFSILDGAHTKPGCAGKPGVHSRLQVVRPDPERKASPDEVLPDGETGEIIASLDSDESFREYYNRPDANEKALRGGWYFTGDLGFKDADGDYWVVGRVDDMIITGGENVHPVEVEDVLMDHPGVVDCGVVGLPDDKWGQVVSAFVVRRSPEVTAEALDQFCRDRSDLANFKRPRRFSFVREIPRSSVGKLLRRKLIAGEYESES